MAESNNGNQGFKALQDSSGKENYDRLLSVFRIGTEVKRSLLEQYLSGKHLDLLDWLSDLNQSFLKFDDIKRAIKRSSTIDLKDLDASTIDILLKFNCFDLFWKVCLLKTKLEDILNSHKEELLGIYENSMRQHVLLSSSKEQYTPSLTKNQWKLLFKSDQACRIEGMMNAHDISANKDITLSSLDESLNILLLYTVCPLFQSVNIVSECQIKISKIAVLDTECLRPTFDTLWNKIEYHIIRIAVHCNISTYFKCQCKKARQTVFNRAFSQDNRRYILEDAFNNPDFIMEKLFCNRVREELDLIKIEDNLNLSRKLCGQEILILLENGKYTTGAYSLGVVENADKGLNVMKSVCSNQCHRVMDSNQNETENEMQTDDIQKGINKHNHLKVVQLITSIAKDVLVGVLKGRLLGANFGYALTGMKKRLLPQLNTHGRQVLYPEGSSYSGDFSDLDISLIYIILRNMNTIAPHSNDWGNVPNDCDRSLSANIDRIRIFKNKYVSHCSNMSLNDQDLKQTVKEIRQCILELGGDDYMCDIDSMLTSEINPVIEQELCITLRRLKDADRETESNYIRLKEDINEIKQYLRMPDRQPINKATAANGAFGSLPVEFKIEGTNIPLVEEIKKRTKELSSEDMQIPFAKEGSIIIGLKVSASALHTVGKFIRMIDTLLSKILKMYQYYGNGDTSCVIASVNFLDKQNESIRFPIKHIVEEETVKEMEDNCKKTVRNLHRRRRKNMNQLMLKSTTPSSTKTISGEHITEGIVLGHEKNMNQLMLKLTTPSSTKTSTREHITEGIVLGRETSMKLLMLKLTTTSNVNGSETTKRTYSTIPTVKNVKRVSQKHKATHLNKKLNKINDGFGQKHEEYQQLNIVKLEPK